MTGFGDLGGEPLHGDGEEEIVTVGIEVGSVGGVLEVLGAEGLAAHIDHACGIVVVEQRDLVTLAGLLDDTHHVGEAWLVEVPGGDEADAGIGAVLLDAGEHHLERVGKHLQRVGIVLHLVGIVMASDDEHVVGIGCHGLVALPHGRTEVVLVVVGAVEGDA